MGDIRKELPKPPTKKFNKGIIGEWREGRGKLFSPMANLVTIFLKCNTLTKTTFALIQIIVMKNKPLQSTVFSLLNCNSLSPSPISSLHLPPLLPSVPYFGSCKLGPWEEGHTV
jgi:hypothetical protein